MFLSVVTRTHPKPVDYLSVNQASLAEQIDQDYEQIVIRDEQGRGLAWANAQFAANAHRPAGDYVIMLDDDNALATPAAITILKAVTWDRPELIMFKAEVGPHGILPTREAWQERRPIPWQVDGHCCIARTDIWRQYIDHFAVDVRGDAAFLTALYGANVRTEWINAVLVRALRVGSLNWTAIQNGDLPCPANT
jgi:hypothetical protein